MGDSYILIAISVLASVSSSYGSQDQVITTSFGKTATLQCPIANQGSDLRSLYWKKDGTAIYSLSSNGVHTSGKYSVTDTASLVISDVTESDVGNYSCIVAFWKSSGTEESDVMQLYVIEVFVSHCKDTGQMVDGCSCSIDGSNITSLECSASGFPHPPDITWEEDRITYRSSSVDLTRIKENITLTCKARDGNLKGSVENKTVCVYYEREVTSTGGSPVEATTASVKFRACIAVIVVLSFALILLLLYMYIRYIRKKGKAFHFPTSSMCTSMSKESSVGDLPTSQPGGTSIAGGTGDVDFPTEDCNQNVSLPMPAMPSSVVPINPWPFLLRGELQSCERAMMYNAISRIIPSFSMQSNMTSSMASSVVAYNSPALLWELRRSYQSDATYNTTSPIYPGFDRERGYSGLRGYICLNYSTVTWTSSVSDPVLQTWQEEEEIPDPPPTAKLLEDKCGDSEESDNEHHDYMNT